MEKDDGVAATGIDVGHFAVEHGERVALIGVVGGDIRLGHGDAPIIGLQTRPPRDFAA
jgi:hypothetical protein